ncbi:hypothetical protein AX16_008372 [Volvariella volvacea WC 439]|nr:hypothetical protein AX16_008372 [Volvariella volvacea WC 439]
MPSYANPRTQLHHSRSRHVWSGSNVLEVMAPILLPTATSRPAVRIHRQVNDSFTSITEVWRSFQHLHEPPPNAINIAVDAGKLAFHTTCQWHLSMAHFI